MNKIMQLIINKYVERKMARIEKMLLNTKPEEFQKGVEEVIKVLDKANQTIEKLESL